MSSLLNENSIVEADVKGADGITRHESWDAIDIIESHYTFNQMLAEYRLNGVQEITLKVVF